MTGAAGGWRRHGHIERAGRCAGPRRRRIGRGEGVGAGRQVRRREAPGAGAAVRGRGAERARAAIRHRHRRTVRCGSGQGHRLIGIGHAAADDWRGGRVGGAVTVTSKRAGRCAGPRRRRIGRGKGVGASRQVRRGEAPGAGAAVRGRGAERAPPPSDTVTVAPSGAVPVRVTNSLEFATPVLMTGAAGVVGATSELLVWMMSPVVMSTLLENVQFVTPLNG